MQLFLTVNNKWMSLIAKSKAVFDGIEFYSSEELALMNMAGGDLFLVTFNISEASVRESFFKDKIFEGVYISKNYLPVKDDFMKWRLI